MSLNIWFSVFVSTASRHQLYATSYLWHSVSTYMYIVYVLHYYPYRYCVLQEGGGLILYIYMSHIGDRLVISIGFVSASTSYLCVHIIFIIQRCRKSNYSDPVNSLFIPTIRVSAFIWFIYCRSPKRVQIRLNQI